MQYSKNLANLPPTGGGGGSTTIPDPLTVNDLIVNNSILNRGTTTLVGDVNTVGNVNVGQTLTTADFIATNDIVGSNNFSLIGDANVGGSLDVANNTRLGGTLNVSGSSTFSNVTIRGTTAITGGNVTIGGTGTVVISKPTRINNTFTVNGNFTQNGSVMVSGNAVVFGQLNIEGPLKVYGVPVSMSDWASAPAVTNVDLSGYHLTSSTGIVEISGATNISGGLTVSDISVGSINGFTYPYGYVYGTGILRVDVNGDDASGASSKYVYPFRTIQAALTSATPGDEVFVSPGTYSQNTGLIVPAGVSVRGANTSSVIIQRVNATTSFTLFEMSSNSRLEDATLLLTSSSELISNAHYTLIHVSGSAILTTTLRSLVLNATCTNAGGNVYGVWATGNSANTSVAVPYAVLRGCIIDINASGLRSANGGSNARCIYSTGSNRVTTRDTNCFVTGTNCVGAQLIGCETTVSGSYMDLQSSTISASGNLITNCSVAEISQTNTDSRIALGYTNLLHHSANGKGFDVNQTLANYIFGFFSAADITRSTGGANGIGGSNFFLLPGTSTFQIIVDNSSTSAVPYTVVQSGLMHDILLRVNNNANLADSTLHMKLFVNNTTTPICALSVSGTNRIATIPNTSFTVNEGDSVYVNLSFSAGSTNLTNFRSCTVDFGLL